jgi:hypothetical protein
MRPITGVEFLFQLEVPPRIGRRACQPQAEQTTPRCLGAASKRIGCHGIIMFKCGGAGFVHHPARGLAHQLPVGKIDDTHGVLLSSLSAFRRDQRG